MADRSKDSPGISANKVGASLSRIVSRVASVGCDFSALLVIALAAVVVYQVLARYLVRWSTIWTLEVSQYMLVSIVWLTMAHLVMRRGHVAVDLLVTKLSTAKQNLLQAIFHVGILAFGIVLVYESLPFAVAAFVGGHLSESHATPLWPVYFVIPLGGLLLSIAALAQIVAGLGAFLSASRGAERASDHK